MTDKYTLAEIESYLRKAAQAVGLDWGIAEEAGKSARWLAAFGLPGPELMLAQLQQLEGKDYHDFIPDCGDGQWRAKSACLCPIITGAAAILIATDMHSEVFHRVAVVTKSHDAGHGQLFHLG